MTPKNQTDSTAKVGIFMPCFNLGAYVEEALDSLENQTFQDFEVLIADDCSTDGITIDKLKSLLLPENYSLHFEQHNLGMNKITNKYTRRLNNQYLLIFSPDDRLHPDFLQETVAVLEESSSYSAVTPWLRYFDEGHGVREYRQENTTLPEMLKQNNFSGSSLMRKNLWDSIGGYDESPEFRIHQDYDFWLSALEKGAELAVIEKPLFDYRILSSSLSRDVNVDKERRWFLKLVSKHSSSYQNHFQDVLVHYYTQSIQSSLDLKIGQEGHQWLDSEYKRILKEIDKAKVSIEKLSSDNELLYKYSYTRFRDTVKHTIKRLTRQSK